MSPEVLRAYAGTYAVPQPYVLAGKRPRALSTARARRWLRLVLVAALVAAVVWVMRTLAQQGLVPFVSDYYVPLLLGLAFLCFGHVLDRVPNTHISAEALTARTGMLTQRSVPWTQVQAITLATRFELYAVAQLSDGTTLALPGLPDEVAAGLAAAIAETRRPSA